MKTVFKTVLLAVLAGSAIFGGGPAMADPRHGDREPDGRGGWSRHDDRRDNDRGRDYRRDDYRLNGDRGWNDRRVVYAPVRPFPERPFQKRDVIIARGDRDVIYTYLRDNRGRGVYGSIPGGVYGGRPYLVGAPLPAGVAYYAVPRYVLSRMAPVPAGYRYVRVDNDVLLMAEAARLILDAVTL